MTWEPRLDQPSVAMDTSIAAMLDRAVEQAGAPPHRMSSGAGHDAMVLAAKMPAGMLFLRCEGGISHHPAENVREDDVAAALEAGLKFLDELALGSVVTDTIVRGGTLVTPDGRVKADIRISDGRIVEIAPELTRRRAARSTHAAFTCFPGSSTCTCISTSPGAPIGKAPKPAATRSPPAAARCSSTCRSTRRRAR